jgi:prophage regulatory protein
MAIWRLPAVKAEFGWRSDASAYNSIRAGVLTTGVAIGQRSRGWPDYEVKAIAAARIAGRSDEEVRNLVQVLHAKRSELATV